MNGFNLADFQVGFLSFMAFREDNCEKRECWLAYVEVLISPSGSFCSTFMNVIWFLLGGIWLALLHTFFGILFAITIIGLPCARQHFKMASLAIYPFGLEVASDEETTHIHHQHQQRQPGYQVA